MNLSIHIARRNEHAYRAWCPSLPGCQVIGDSVQEARDKIRQAVRGYLSSLEVALPRELVRLSQAPLSAGEG